MNRSIPTMDTTTIRRTLHAVQRLRQTDPGDHVHTAGTRYRDDLVSLLLEHVDNVPADPSSRPHHRHLHATTESGFAQPDGHVLLAGLPGAACRELDTADIFGAVEGR